MQIEIDGYVFDINVKHYEPTIPGSFSFNAESDVDYLGRDCELEFDVDGVTACATYCSDYSFEHRFVGKEQKEIVNEFYPELYSEVLKALESENSVH